MFEEKKMDKNMSKEDCFPLPLKQKYSGGYLV